MLFISEMQAGSD